MPPTMWDQSRHVPQSRRASQTQLPPPPFRPSSASGTLLLPLHPLMPLLLLLLLLMLVAVGPFWPGCWSRLGPSGRDRALLVAPLSVVQARIFCGAGLSVHHQKPPLPLFSRTFTLCCRCCCFYCCCWSRGLNSLATEFACPPIACCVCGCQTATHPSRLATQRL